MKSNHSKKKVLKFLTELPKEARPIMALCAFESLVVVASAGGLYVLGRPGPVDAFVENFSLRGVVAAQTKPAPEQTPPDNRQGTGGNP